MLTWHRSRLRAPPGALRATELLRSALPKSALLTGHRPRRPHRRRWAVVERPRGELHAGHRTPTAGSARSRQSASFADHRGPGDPRRRLNTGARPARRPHEIAASVGSSRGGRGRGARIELRHARRLPVPARPRVDDVLGRARASSDHAPIRATPACPPGEDSRACRLALLAAPVLPVSATPTRPRSARSTTCSRTASSGCRFVRGGVEHDAGRPAITSRLKLDREAALGSADAFVERVASASSPHRRAVPRPLRRRETAAKSPARGRACGGYRRGGGARASVAAAGPLPAPRPRR